LQREIAFAVFGEPRTPGLAVHFSAGKKQVEEPV